MRRTTSTSLSVFRCALHSASHALLAYVFVPVRIVAGMNESVPANWAEDPQVGSAFNYQAAESHTRAYVWVDEDLLDSTVNAATIELPHGIIVSQSLLAHESVAHMVTAAHNQGVEVMIAFPDFSLLPAHFAAMASGFVVSPQEAVQDAELLSAHGNVVVWAVGLHEPGLVAHANAYIGAVHSPGSENSELAPGEVQCMRALHLLSNPNVVLSEVSEVLDLDPVLSVRALHLANSAAFGMSKRLDSIHTAVTFLGTQRISSLLMASLISSRQPQPAKLWFLLTRAETCRVLSLHGEAAYTTGLVSALADEMGTSARALASQTGLSDHIQEAFEDPGSELGSIIAAVKAYEIGNIELIQATGWRATEVAHAYFDALPVTRQAINHLLAPA